MRKNWQLARLACRRALHLQTFLAVQPVHALDVHVLTLASQQRMDAPIAKAPPLGGEAHHASAQCLPLATLVALVMEHRSDSPIRAHARRSEIPVFARIARSSGS